MDRFRNSQLRVLRACHFAYAEQYVRNTPALPSPALSRGAAVHAVIAAASKALLETGLINIHELAYQICRGGNVEFAQALHLATRFQEAVGTEFSIDPDKVFLIEETLEMPIQLANGDVVIFFGTPDLVERLGKRSALITDYKTHWQPDTEEEFLADPQLERYALLVHHNYPGLTEFELTKRFIRYENNFRTRVVNEEDFARIRLDLENEISVARDVAAAGVFEATPGAWCSLCSYTHTCPRIRQYRDLVADDLSVADDDRARELAGDVVALDAFAKQMKESLKTYLGDNHETGFVEVSGGTFGFGPVQNRDVPAPKLIEVLRAHSIEPSYELFNTNKDALDRLLKRSPETVVQAVEAITLRSTSSECRFRKIPKKRAAKAKAAAVAQDELL